MRWSILLCLILGIVIIGAEALQQPGILQRPGLHKATHHLGKRANCGPGEKPNNYDPLTLKYFGSPLMINPLKVYLIFYGTVWPDLPGLKSELTYFINNVGSSDWFTYTQALTDRQGSHISNQISLGGTVDVTNLKQGPIVDQSTIIKIVQDQIASGVFPSDVNGQYYVLNGDDTKITATGAGVDYCGYHSAYSDAQSNDIKYGFIVTDKTNLKVCTFADAGPYSQQVNSAVTTLAHEIIEAMSDPLVGDDTDNRGGYLTSAQVGGTFYENGDMCANIDFPTTTSTNGKQYTTVVGTHQYLLQANVNPVNFCCGFPTTSTLTASPVPPSLPPSPPASVAVGGSISNSPAASSVPASLAPGASPSSTGLPSYFYPSDDPSNTYDYVGCGDGILQAGEDCDPGSYYFGGQSCCNYNCKWKDVNSQCGPRPQNQPCYRAPRCERVTPGKPDVKCSGPRPKLRGTGCKVGGVLGRCRANGTCRINSQSKS